MSLPFSLQNPDVKKPRGFFKENNEVCYRFSTGSSCLVDGATVLDVVDGNLKALSPDNAILYSRRTSNESMQDDLLELLRRQP